MAKLYNPTDLNMQELIDEWKQSREFVELNSKDYPRLDALVDAVPVTHDGEAPYVGDTTLGSVVRASISNSIQQLPVYDAYINGSKNTIPALVATFLLKSRVFNEDTFGKGLLSTLHIAGEQAITRGFAATMPKTGMMLGDFGTTLGLVHYSDLGVEAGVTDGSEAGYHYVKTNLVPSRVRKIVKQAKNNPETSWVVPMLEKLLVEGTPQPTNYSQHESAGRQRQASEAASKVYTFVTRYPVGSPDEPIVTFCPEFSDGPVRVMEQRSKWCFPRVQYLVIDPDGLSPFGVSRVRMVSPNVNFLNIYMGNVASMLMLNSKPPVFQQGRFSTPVQLKQGVTWKTNDPNAKASLITLDNGTLTQFPTVAEYFQRQIQGIMGSPKGSIAPGASGKSSYGNTGPGVRMQQQEQDVQINKLTKIFENYLSQYGLCALDLILSEQEGTDNIIVDDETKNAINQLAPGAIGDDNVFVMNWRDFYDAIQTMQVKVQVSLSKDELDEKKRADIQDMLVVLGQNAQTIPGAAEKVAELTNILLEDKAPLLSPMQPMGAMPAALPAGPAPVAEPAPQPVA